MTDHERRAAPTVLDELVLRRPDDFHAHFRQGAAMALYVAREAASFGRAIAMPNLKPPVVSVAEAAAYRHRLGVRPGTGPAGADGRREGLPLSVHIALGRTVCRSGGCFQVRESVAAHIDSAVHGPAGGGQSPDVLRLQ